MRSRYDASSVANHRSSAPRTVRCSSLIIGAMLAAATVASCADQPSTSSVGASRAAVASATGHAPTHAAPVEIPATGGVAVQVLSRSQFVDDIDATFRIKLEHATDVVHVSDPSDIVTARITVQAGGSFGWHTHHGPVMVSLAAGELTIVHADDCSSQRYTAGQAFVDAGQGHVHVGFNAGSSETVIYATFLDVPAGQGPTIPAQGPTC
jgi:quercetin dioxygenase-like cupin family protein